MTRRKLSEARHRELRQREAKELEAWLLVEERLEGVQRALRALREAEEAHRAASHNYSSVAVMAIAELEG